ncbi:MAG: tetratricopeptide repeat-containing sensor histidine kinase [Bacteroidetes bacterium]|nr:tetratricopeptide repeat-containing sensor histidine kinase [Bacteroidota bacterium]
MIQNPLNIETDDGAVTIEKIYALNKSAWDLKNSDVRLAMDNAQKAVRMALGLKADDDIYTAIIKNTISPIENKKLLGDCLHILAWLDVEFSKFDNAIVSLLFAKKLFEEIDDKDALCRVHVILGSVYVLKGEFKTAIQYNLEGLKIAEEDNNKENATVLLSNAGLTYWNLGDNKKAFEFISKSLRNKREKGDKLDIAKSLNNIGLVYNAMGDYYKALEAYNEAYRIVEELDEKKGVGILYMNIGLIYERLGEPDKAESFLYKALESYKAVDYKKGIGECLVNLALVTRIAGRTETALRYAYESFEVAIAIGDKKVIAFTYQEIMNVFKDKKDYKKALDFALKCYDLRRDIEHKAGVMGICGDIGEILIEMNEIEKALKYLDEGITLGNEVGSKAELLNLYKNISKCYELTGNFEKAVESLKKHIELRDIVSNEETKRRIQNVQAQFEVVQAQRESEIYKLKNIDLAEANKKLEDMNQEKNEFLNLVSHDLKNPLNSIYGFSNLLVEDINTLSMEEISDFASNINISSMAMLDLVNEILNSEMMDSGRYELNNELIDLNVLIKSLISMNKFQLRQKEIKIIFDEKIVSHVFNDSNVIKQIISNLLSNAIKFSPEGKSIFITVAHNKSDSSTWVGIQDEGPGLTEEDRKKLFTKFARLSAKPTAGESSTGLGLSIVKKLADIIGAKVVCESEPGKGAKFILQIPTTPLKIKK